MSGRRFLDNSEEILRWLLLGFAFLLPISIALAQPLAFLSVPVWIVLLFRGRSVRRRDPFIWPVAAFACVALIASLFGVRPQISIPKCHRLLLLLVIFMVPSVWDARSAGRLVGAFVAGCSLRGVYQVLYFGLTLMRGGDLFDTGNMRDPQMYLAALCLLLATPFWKGGWRRGAVGALVACLAGLVLNFKRGAWIAFLLAGTIMAFVGRRFRIFFVIVACAVVALALPPVRARLRTLQDETTGRLGGRYVLWTEIAPEILRDYPQGMGLRAVQHEDLLRYDAKIQPKLNHLHNNLLQVWLETGWAGLIAWLWWMLTALAVMTTSYLRLSRRGDPGAWLALGSLGAFCGLMINGIVEYNFGDSEILMLLCLLMGLSNLAYRRMAGLRTGGA